MTWPPESIDAGIWASLIQSYSVLLSTLLSIGRNQLSYLDGQYALNITSPPLMVYLAISSICDLFGVKTSIYKRIHSHRRTTRVLGILVLPLWLALSITVEVSSTAFTDGVGLTPREWLTGALRSAVARIAFGYGGWYTTWITTSFFSLFLFRGRSQVMVDFRARREGTPKPQGR